MSGAPPTLDDGVPARLADFARDFYHCSDCNYCVDATWAERGIEHVCPTISHHRPIASYSGRGYIAAARAWFEGTAIDEDVLAARAFACTGCGNCEQLCPIGLRPAQIGQTLRETLAERGHAPPAIAELRASMRTHGNPYAQPAATRSEWARELAFVENDATLLYAPGCAAAWQSPAEAAAAVRLMQAAGERVAYRTQADRCCGAPLREAGLAADAAHAESRLASGLAAGAVVTSGFECLPGWRRVTGVRARVFGDWLLEALRAGRLSVTVTPGLRVHVFDGCAARRPGDARVADPLREVLALTGVTPVNDARGAASAVCCGAAGTMRALDATAARRMADARLVAREDADAIVAADPRCRAHLATAATADDAPVLGLAEFLMAHGRVNAST